MKFQNPEDILLDLKEKYGQDPLIYLIRKLIVTTDQAPEGSEEQNKAFDLLKLITKQHAIASNSGAWMDWLEHTDENTLTWESLIQEQPRRVVHDEVDDLETQRSTAPMSYEQKLWKHALDQKNKQSIRSSVVVFFTSLSLSILLILYLVFFYLVPLFTKKIEQPSIQQIQQNNNKKNSPLFLWGNYHHLIQTSSPLNQQYRLNRHYLADLPVENLPEEAKHWVIQVLKKDQLPRNWKKKLIWLTLWNQENNFNEAFPPQSPPKASLVIPRLPYQKNWSWFRRNPEREILHEGKFQSHIKKNKRGQLEFIIKRTSHRDGVAHRFILSKRGLVAWAWSFKFQGHKFEGSIYRHSKKRSYILKTKGFSWEKQKIIINTKDNTFLIPALWSPVLSKFKNVSVIFPISGKVVPAYLFFGDLQTQGDLKKGFKVLSNLEPWIESWDLEEAQRK